MTNPENDLWKETIALIPGAAIEDTEAYIPDALSGILEAGHVYLSWLHDGLDQARRRLDKWIRRSSSEFSIQRIVLLTVNQRVAGGYLALPGAELKACQKADTMALLMDMKGQSRQLLASRLNASRSQEFPTEGDEFFLSKLWVDSEFRGKKLAHLLLNHYIYQGLSRGFSKFRVIVRASDTNVVRLYESHGFKTTHSSSFPEMNLEALSMLRTERKR